MRPTFAAFEPPPAPPVAPCDLDRPILHWGLPDWFAEEDVSPSVGLFTEDCRGLTLKKALELAERRKFSVRCHGLPVLGPNVQAFGIRFDGNFYPLMLTLGPAEPSQDVR